MDKSTYKKSRIRETKHLSTDADSSTDTKKNSENLKSLDIGLREVGAKRPLNGVRNTDTKKILLSKAKFAQKQFLRSDFSPFISKSF